MTYNSMNTSTLLAICLTVAVSVGIMLWYLRKQNDQTVAFIYWQETNER